MLVERLGLPQRMLAIEKRPGLDVAVDLVDALEAGLTSSAERDAALADVGGRLAQRKRAQAHVRRSSRGAVRLLIAACRDSPAATARCPGRCRPAPCEEHHEHERQRAAEDVGELHLRRRHPLQVEGRHRDRRRVEGRLRVERHQDAEEDRIDVEIVSSGRKIGTKMMMISVHSSGQPSRKMMTCVSSRNRSATGSATGRTARRPPARRAPRTPRRTSTSR